MKITYTKARRKIAIAFSILASLLIAATTITTVVFVNWTMDRQAQITLDTSLQSVSKDYANNNLVDKEATYQSSRVSADSANINQQKVISDIDLSKVSEQKAVYTRVVKTNGDIAVTSDLFNTYKITDLSNGFKKLYFGDTCIYLISARTNSGDIIQNAIYCPFTNAQQLTLFGLMGGIGIFTAVFTYFLGLLMAKLFLRPLENSAQQTKEFIQNAYHELYTPITVAMTTVEASRLSKDYESGINSVHQDLDSMRSTLLTLHDSLTHDLAKHEKTNLVAIIEPLITSRIKFSKPDKKVIKQVSPEVVRIIFRNLIDNSLKYAPKDAVIKINLTDKSFTIANDLVAGDEIDVSKLFTRGYRGSNAENVSGHGLGLAIVKELATQIGWKVNAEFNNHQLVMSIGF